MDVPPNDTVPPRAPRMPDALCDWSIGQTASVAGGGGGGGPRCKSHDAMNAEALVLVCQGAFVEALKLFNRILETTEEPRQRGIALQNIGTVMAQQGHLGTAERAFAESFGWFRHAQYRLGEAMALNNHARVALDRGNPQLA